MTKLESRDGDVLVVAYPEVSIPIGSGSYSSVKIGGLIYTRKLLLGDDVASQYDSIYTFLKERAVRDGKLKIAEFQTALRQIRAS